MSMIERLHLAVIQAVAILNAVPDRDACKANAILRSALVEYADWMAEQPMSENNTPAPDWEHLKQYGYAPGSYMSKCLRCGGTPIMDKRAITCRPCAEALHAEAERTPAPAGDDEGLPRKLLDVACRIRAGESLFRDDELVDQAAHALKKNADDMRAAIAAKDAELAEAVEANNMKDLQIAALREQLAVAVRLLREAVSFQSAPSEG